MADALQGQPGQAIETSVASNHDLPAWYQAYTSNLGQQASQVAQHNITAGAPQAQVAGFNPTQAQGFQQVASNQGSWMPGMGAATNTLGQIGNVVGKGMYDANAAASGGAASAAGAGGALIAQGQAAVAGPAKTWNAASDAANYMSPYTSQVVNSIATLGNQNWKNNIMGGINAQMVGAGNFGSTRNADALGQAGAQVQNDISAQQSQALQAGWNAGTGLFTQDANRTQQQGALQSNAAMSGANINQTAATADANRAQENKGLQATTALQAMTSGGNLLNTTGMNQGALSQMTSHLGQGDAQNMIGIGNQQQGLQQTGLTTDYNNQIATQQQPWTQLQNAGNIMQGVQLPGSTTSTSSAPANNYGPSPVDGALSAYFLSQGLKADGSPRTPWAYTNPGAPTTPGGTS